MAGRTRATRFQEIATDPVYVWQRLAESVHSEIEKSAAIACRTIPPLERESKWGDLLDPATYRVLSVQRDLSDANASLADSKYYFSFLDRKTLQPQMARRILQFLHGDGRPSLDALITHLAQANRSKRLISTLDFLRKIKSEGVRIECTRSFREQLHHFLAVSLSSIPTTGLLSGAIGEALTLSRDCPRTLWLSPSWVPDSVLPEVSVWKLKQGHANDLKWSLIRSTSGGERFRQDINNVMRNELWNLLDQYLTPLFADFGWFKPDEFSSVPVSGLTGILAIPVTEFSPPKSGSQIPLSFFGTHFGWIYCMLLAPPNTPVRSTPPEDIPWLQHAVRRIANASFEIVSANTSNHLATENINNRSDHNAAAKAFFVRALPALTGWSAHEFREAPCVGSDESSIDIEIVGEDLSSQPTDISCAALFRPNERMYASLVAGASSCVPTRANHLEQFRSQVELTHKVLFARARGYFGNQIRNREESIRMIRHQFATAAISLAKSLVEAKNNDYRIDDDVIVSGLFLESNFKSNSLSGAEVDGMTLFEQIAVYGRLAVKFANERRSTEISRESGDGVKLREFDSLFKESSADEIFRLICHVDLHASPAQMRESWYRGFALTFTLALRQAIYHTLRFSAITKRTLGLDKCVITIDQDSDGFLIATVWNPAVENSGESKDAQELAMIGQRDGIDVEGPEYAGNSGYQIRLKLKPICVKF